MNITRLIASASADCIPYHHNGDWAFYIACLFKGLEQFTIICLSCNVTHHLPKRTANMPSVFELFRPQSLKCPAAYLLQCHSNQYICNNNTHSWLVTPICNFLPLRDELVCRCASFISKCLHSENSVVRALAGNVVYFVRMLTPIGVNSQLCCDYYGLPLLNIHAVCKNLLGLSFASQFYWN